jgi:hypothetical protein
LPQVAFATIKNDFHSAFEQWEPYMRGRVANLLFLDQSGVKQIAKPVLQAIVRLFKTDFIFFICSAMVNRFRTLPEIRHCVPAMDEDLKWPLWESAGFAGKNHLLFQASSACVWVVSAANRSEPVKSL